MPAQQKLVMARALDALGVDIIETGFPASSQSDYEAMTLIARELRRPTLAVLSRCLQADIRNFSTRTGISNQTTLACISVNQPITPRAQATHEQGTGAGVSATSM